MASCWPRFMERWPRNQIRMRPIFGIPWPSIARWLPGGLQLDWDCEWEGAGKIKERRGEIETTATTLIDIWMRLWGRLSPGCIAGQMWRPRQLLPIAQPSRFKANRTPNPPIPIPCRRIHSHHQKASIFAQPCNFPQPANAIKVASQLCDRLPLNSCSLSTV